MQRIERRQFIPVNIKVAWGFFSDPGNLSRITPPEMGFMITTPVLNGPVYEGMIIAYIVKPMFSIPVRWITEITHVKNLEYFIDDQTECTFFCMLANQYNRMIEVRVIEARHRYKEIA